MRDQLRRSLFTLVTAASLLATATPAHAAVAPTRVTIIVGPVGSMTDSYRSQADATAAAAEAAGAVVTKVYSPEATWSAVKAAVNGANVIVYYGHGNGYPNPYSTSYLADRVDGWGLNTKTTNGDADSWSAGTLVYCGEKALLGTLTSSDGSAQRTYCSGGPVTPAPGFVMIYANACYAPGASEPGTTAATPTQALQRVAYYSRPVLASLGASAYFATDHGAATLVSAILANPDTAYGDIYTAKLPTGLTVTQQAHPLVTGDAAWLGKRSTDPYYTYAFAGDPTASFSGAPALLADAAPRVVSFTPAPSATGVSMTPTVQVGFSEPVENVSAATIVLWDATTWKAVAATVSLSDGGTLATLAPKAPLQPKRKYALRVSARITDATGNALTYASMVFTTAYAETYSPARKLVFAAGTYTGYKFSSTGAVTAKRSYTLARASGAPTGKRSGIAAHSGGWYYVTSGVWAGYWIAEGAGVALQ